MLLQPSSGRSMKKRYADLTTDEQNQLDYFFAGTDERQRLLEGSMSVQEAARIVKDALENAWALVQQSDEAFLSFYREVQPENARENFLGRVCQKVQEQHPLLRARGNVIPDQIPDWARGEVSVLRFARKSANPVLDPDLVKEVAETLAQEKEYRFKSPREGSLAPSELLDDLLERLTRMGKHTNSSSVYRALKKSGFRAPNAWYSYKMKPVSRKKHVDISDKQD